RQPFLPPQLLVELRCRNQLRPAQPPSELPDHPPRPVLRHCREQQHNEERRRQVRGPLHEVPQCLVLVDVAPHQPMQSAVVVHRRRPLQPLQPILDSLVGQHVPIAPVLALHRLDLVAGHKQLLALGRDPQEQCVTRLRSWQFLPRSALQVVGQIQPLRRSPIPLPVQPHRKHEEQAAKEKCSPRPHVRPARPRFAVLLPAPLRHPQTSSTCGSPAGPLACFLVSLRAASIRSRARCPFTASARSISPRISASVIGPCACPPLLVRNWRLRNSVRNASTSASVTRPASAASSSGSSTPGAASNTARTHSESVMSAWRAHSSSAANSSSLTFVPMDFVRSGAFIAH